MRIINIEIFNFDIIVHFFRPMVSREQNSPVYLMGNDKGETYAWGEVLSPFRVKEYVFFEDKDDDEYGYDCQFFPDSPEEYRLSRNPLDWITGLRLMGGPVPDYVKARRQKQRTRAAARRQRD